MLLIIYFLLVLAIISGLFGLFFYQEYVKKISCLAVAYSSFLALLVILSGKSSQANELILIMVTILIIFAINLLIGITIISNINKSK
jgi:hypothetical protein